MPKSKTLDFGDTAIHVDETDTIDHLKVGGAASRRRCAKKQWVMAAVVPEVNDAIAASVISTVIDTFTRYVPVIEVRERSAGLCPQRRIGLLTARQANRQRFH